ncbi:MAG: peptide chain release factor 2 [Anaerolineae bacterium]
MMGEIRSRLALLSEQIEATRRRLDIPGKKAEIARLEEKSSSADIWNDPQAARAVMRELAALREQVETWDQLAGRVEDALAMLELAEEADDQALAAEAAAEADQIQEDFTRLEFRLAMSGPYDRNNAILSVHAGAGGTEAQDWAQMLMRMYLRWAERRSYQTTITDMLEGEEAGIKTVTIEVEGPWAYGYLKAERGVHRLVRISPFDASARRHTSFALVEVLPMLEDDIEIEIKPEDIRMDVYRSGGAGGQHMQKNSTAVRLTHIPTGIVVTCQNERSQLQNRESAMRVLRGKLFDIELQKLEAEQARLKGKHVEAGWGNQIRSYVLQPYQMVKDLRTGIETSNTTAVLDGEIDLFIEAWLKEQLGGNGRDNGRDG